MSWLSSYGGENGEVWLPTVFLKMVDVGIPTKVMRMVRVFPYLQNCGEDGEGWPPTYSCEYGVGFGSLHMVVSMVRVGSLPMVVRMVREKKTDWM